MEPKKVLAINGSPRKKWNTGVLLQKVLDGAVMKDAQTELVHLYDLNFKGCISCFACKQVGGPYYGRCAVQDGATPILDRIDKDVDALVLGSPVYFGAMTGEMRSFLERLLFAKLIYSKPPRSCFPRQIKTALIYTMNATEEMAAQRSYAEAFSVTQNSMKMIFGSCEMMMCYDTLQFADYTKVQMEMFNAADKTRRHQTVFPQDCQAAVDLGLQLG